MKSEVRKIDSLKRELTISAEGELVRDKFNHAFERIAKNAKAPGFRPGHLPRPILEKNFAGQANQIVVEELLPQLYDEAVAKEKLETVALPEISDVKLDRNSISFKARVEVTPQIKIREYKGIRLNFKKVSLNADELKRQIDSLKESRKIDTIDDRFARGLGYPSLAELEASIERQVFLQKETQARRQLEEDATEAVTKGVDVALPASIVSRRLEELVSDAKLELAFKGMSRQQVEETEKKLRQDLLPRAEKDTRFYLIFSQIAKKENIPLDKQMASRVMELILKSAEWNILD